MSSSSPRPVSPSSLSDSAVLTTPKKKSIERSLLSSSFNINKYIASKEKRTSLEKLISNENKVDEKVARDVQKMRKKTQQTISQDKGNLEYNYLMERLHLQSSAQTQFIENIIKRRQDEKRASLGSDLRELPLSNLLDRVQIPKRRKPTTKKKKKKSEATKNHAAAAASPATTTPPKSKKKKGEGESSTTTTTSPSASPSTSSPASTSNNQSASSPPVTPPPAPVVSSTSPLRSTPLSLFKQLLKPISPVATSPSSPSSPNTPSDAEEGSPVHEVTPLHILPKRARPPLLRNGTTGSLPLKIL